MDAALTNALLARATQLLVIGLAFGFIVFVHELGHFLGARLSGMAVHEFSLGIGRPLLFWFRRGETQYSLRLWPFFSYVRIAGMEPGDPHPRGFDRKTRPAQALVLALGCAMNFLLGVAIFVFVGAVVGRPVGVVNTIERVLPGSPAARAGLMAGDRLVGVGGKRNLALEKIQEAIRSHMGTPVTLEVERDGRRMSVTLVPRRETEPKVEGSRLIYEPVGRIGIVFRMRTERMGVLRSVAAGFATSYEMTRMLTSYLVGVVSGKMPLVLMGPVGAAHQLYNDVKVSWTGFLGTAAALTIGIGFLNLLPIPPLDGSRLVILGLEAIRRRPFDKQKEVMVHLVGFALLMVLVVVLTYKDILRILGVGQ